MAFYDFLTTHAPTLEPPVEDGYVDGDSGDDIDDEGYDDDVDVDDACEEFHRSTRTHFFFYISLV
jgi:hypothetical protein